MSATLRATPKLPQTGGGNRGPVNRRFFGGGSGGRGDGLPDYAERLRRCRMGLALALVAIGLVFITFSVAYLLRLQDGLWDPDTQSYIQGWLPLHLPLSLLLVDTVVLTLSTVTIELARRQAVERMILDPLLTIPGISAGARPWPWLALSGLLGAAFLAGQALCWRVLMMGALDTPAAPYFYLLTGAHAAHIAAGLLALAYAGATSSLIHRSLEARRILIDITAWYWHAMAALWLYLLAVLTLAR